MTTSAAIEKMNEAVMNGSYSAARKETLNGVIRVLGMVGGDLNQYTIKSLTSVMADLGYAKNTQKKTVDGLKHLCKVAEIDVNTSSWRVKGEQVDSVYLTEAELKRLSEIDGTIIPMAKLCANIFIVMAYAGTRISDYTKIGTGAIRMKKTGGLALPQLPKIAMDILAQYNNELPQVSKSVMNKHIKIACRMAGIDKWKKVCSHTARRSCCSNLWLRGVPPQFIMAISGHESISSLMKYIRCTASDILKQGNVWGYTPDNNQFKVSQIL